MNEMGRERERFLLSQQTHVMHVGKNFVLPQENSSMINNVELKFS